jgi:hypothetical protein
MFSHLRQCIRSFGPTPRNFSLWDRLTYLHVSAPRWARGNPPDDLMILFQNMGSLFQDGVVTWGIVIQANQLMYEPGNDNCPGEVVYSLSDRATPEYLQSVAAKIGSLKGTEPEDPELRPIAEYLTDEMIRVFGLRVPTVLSDSAHCRISTTFFVRKHLPGRKLFSPLIPLVVSPDEPHLAMTLPARYWPNELIDWW